LKKIGFLHTSPVHVPTFDRLLPDHATAGQLVHLVDELLLAQAMASGVDEDIERKTFAHLDKLAKVGCDQVVCTCSTIGRVAEQMPSSTADISRIDRPMAAGAVKNHHVILVVAAIKSTLAPTRALLLDESRRQNRPIRIQELVLEETWSAFLEGDFDAYYQGIADGIRQHLFRDGGCEIKLPPEVIVVAQASMAPAVDLLQDVSLLILTSPQTCVDHLLGEQGENAEEYSFWRGASDC
jgi:hypothetical protein